MTHIDAPTHGLAHERQMLDWYGLRPSTARACLRVVLGKRCVASIDWDCLCQTVMHRQPFDHVYIWLDRDGQHVMTLEPYDLTPRRIEELTAQMAGLGITVTVGDRSPWYPGSTTLLLLTRTAP